MRTLSSDKYRRSLIGSNVVIVEPTSSIFCLSRYTGFLLCGAIPGGRSYVNEKMLCQRPELHGDSAEQICRDVSMKLPRSSSFGRFRAMKTNSYGNFTISNDITRCRTKIIRTAVATQEFGGEYLVCKKNESHRKKPRTDCSRESMDVVVRRANDRAFNESSDEKQEELRATS